ncbi:hypothetical protein HBH47_023480 [Parastagonospora nodorum]|nr:hypothetical protein HBH47_023480 [Parastagonospora nodorum]
MEFPTYEQRLRNIIDAISSMSSFSLTPQWKEDLDKQEHDTEFWANAISEGTSTEVKQLLSGRNPPAPEEFRTLPIISQDLNQPGSYLGVVEFKDREEDEECFVYQGSATRVGRGLSDRVYKQHSDPTYREKELSKHVKSLFYQVLRSERRSVVFYLMMSMNWKSAAAKDITLTRQICVLSEQIYMIWVGTYAHSAASKAQKTLAELSPWYGLEKNYTGTNLASPLRTDIARAEKDATAMTPQALNQRTADLHRERKANWTPDELQQAQDKRHSYHARVANPVRRFKDKAKKQGMSKANISAKVKAFQTAERLAMQSGETNTNNAETILNFS